VGIGGGVERHRDRAGGQRAEEPGDPAEAVASQDRDPIAGRDPELDELGGDRAAAAATSA
jgi:hypothetical protein